MRQRFYLIKTIGISISARSTVKKCYPEMCLIP